MGSRRTASPEGWDVFHSAVFMRSLTHSYKHLFSESHLCPSTEQDKSYPPPPPRPLSMNAEPSSGIQVSRNQIANSRPPWEKCEESNSSTGKVSGTGWGGRRSSEHVQSASYVCGSASKATTTTGEVESLRGQRGRVS